MSNYNEKRVGRVRLVEKEERIAAILRFKDRIITDSNTIISKSSRVWQEISEQLNEQISAKTIYNNVVNNVFGVREKLFGKVKAVSESLDAELLDETPLNNSSNSDSMNESVPKNREQRMKIVVSFSRREFDNLLTEKRVKLKKHDGHSHRRMTVFKPGLWQQILSEKIWNATHVKCGYNFKNHYLNNDATSGSINGSCKCGGKIQCTIHADENSAKFSCVLMFGAKKCGKRYLRQPERSEVAKKLCREAIVKYRARQAQILMSPGDPQPPILFKSSVLKTAKYEEKSADRLHEDPILALSILKNMDGGNSIHEIGYDPFYVHYWTTHQLHVYKLYAKKGPSCVSFDATGGIFHNVTRMKQASEKALFLYCGVINYEGVQLPIAQMVSESHTTVTIQHFLQNWVRLGAPPPKEVVCDFSRALLSATIRSFTGYLTIEKYASACKSGIPSPCYVRVDVAHVTKIYAQKLKDKPQRIKSFFLGSIAKLIVCTDISAARTIFKHILIVCKSETDGMLVSGEPCACEKSKIALRNMLTGDKHVQKIMETLETNNEVTEKQVPDDDDDCPSSSNLWTEWGKVINEEVEHIIDGGDRDNAHFFPELAARLLKEVATLPLWTCVTRDNFGYGRIPATSCYVECEFNNIKNRIIDENERCGDDRIRVDLFVEKHILHLNGSSKLAEADLKEKDIDDPTNESDENPHEEFLEESCEPESFLSNTTNVDDSFVDQEITLTKIPPIEVFDNVDISPKNDSAVTTLREFENWKGLASKDSLYYSDSKKLADMLNFTKCSKVPMLQNGNVIELSSIEIDGTSYTVRNTCTFDALVHTVLVASTDNPQLLDWVRSCSSNAFFKLIVQIIDSKGRIHPSMYRTRATILHELFDADSVFESTSSKILNCASNVIYLISMLFRNYPSYEEVSKCDNGCPPRHKRIMIVGVTKENLMTNDIGKVVTNILTVNKKRCYRQKTCDFYETSELVNLGTFMFLEIYSDTTTNAIQMRIKDLDNAKQFSVPFKNGEVNYQLVGIVDFQLGQVTRKNMKSVGHYTVICPRNHQYFEYDDLKTKAIKRNSNHKINPECLIYIKLERNS